MLFFAPLEPLFLLRLMGRLHAKGELPSIAPRGLLPLQPHTLRPCRALSHIPSGGAVALEAGS